MRAQFITAAEVEQTLGVSRSKAYQIIRALNKELKAMGYITIAGKCPIQYFQQKFYGMDVCNRSILRRRPHEEILCHPTHSCHAVQHAGCERFR